MADEKNEETFNTKKWLGDSGASSHIGKDSNYMNNVKTTQEKVTIGDLTTVGGQGPQPGRLFACRLRCLSLGVNYFLLWS